VEDARRLADTLGIETVEVDISGPVDALCSAIPGFDPSARVALGNVRARIRMVILYYLANSGGLLVAGTGDRSELLLGYFTKYGDGAVDMLPIGDLYKTQVRMLGERLGLPESIVRKPSAPRLWEGHTARSELGLDYEVIDLVLYCLFDLGLSPEEAAEEVGVGEDVVEAILRRHRESAHKRTLPPVASVRALRRT